MCIRDSYLPGEVRKYQRAPGNVYGWEQVQDPGDASWPLPWLGTDGRPLGFAVWSFRVPGGSELSPSALALQDSLNTVSYTHLTLPTSDLV